MRLAVVSCGVSWEREKDDAEGWGRVFGSGRRMLTRRWGGGFCKRHGLVVLETPTGKKGNPNWSN